MSVSDVGNGSFVFNTAAAILAWHLAGDYGFIFTEHLTLEIY